MENPTPTEPPTEPPTTPPDGPQQPRPVINPIVYDLPATQTASATVSALVEQTQAKFAARAARFGTPVVRRAGDVQVLGARRAALRTGFATGFDPGAPEHAALRAKRAARFGIVPVETKPAPPEEGQLIPVARADPLERRRDVAVGEAPRENVLHVFGVDNLSTPQIMAHFKEYGPTWCEWLNDSSCNIAFEDSFTVARVLRGMASAADHVPEEPVDKMGDEEGAGTSVAVAGEGQLREELKWKPATPVTTRNASVPIWIRMATETDVRPAKPNPKSKWSRSMSREHDREQTRRRPRAGESHDERRRRPSTHGVSLGVQKTRDAIAKVNAKKITRADLDKPLSS